MAGPQSRQRSLRILVLNANSSTAMTSGAVAAAEKLGLPNIEIYSYTPPSSAPASIDNQEDIDKSTQVILDDAVLAQDLEGGKYDAVLVACFSVHSLVGELSKYKHIAVTGIFEASITTVLSLTPAPLNNEKWGIVTTGKFWEDHLGDGVKAFLGQDSTAANHKFAGVFTSGLTAGDFHTVSPEEVKAKLETAVAQLFASGNVSCVVMGCAGMAGLEDTIRASAIASYGKDAGEQVYIVDGVKAGILQLEQTVRSIQAFR
ncbi:Asp/Glu/hydantoin racemase [Ilyonectria robusta]|uniref:Asp/Glu/hydantoin racemase n=1 Tax=Ilyonectria robusta TaxID=1079257 RepID=UPI001E8D8FD2|nr:Asp/Glu/hydantoin racemase [Ilyonectria robusta]KAH8706229.1 Asp/Glu/hydantoin racemase [Ilyonectria robusta]